MRHIKYYQRHLFDSINARVAELVDAHDSNSCSIGVPVRFRSRVLDGTSSIYLNLSRFSFPPNLDLLHLSGQIVKRKLNTLTK